MAPQQPSLVSSILVFTASFILLAVIVNVVLWVLITYAGMGSESGSALGWMPPIIGAMMAGQRYGKLAGAKPPQSYSWMAGFAFAVLTMALIALAYFVMFQLIQTGADMSFGALMDDMGLNLFLGVFGGLFVLMWVLQRFAFSFGAGQAVKLAAMQAAKQKG